MKVEKHEDYVNEIIKITGSFTELAQLAWALLQATRDADEIVNPLIDQTYFEIRMEKR